MKKYILALFWVFPWYAASQDFDKLEKKYDVSLITTEKPNPCYNDLFNRSTPLPDTLKIIAKITGRNVIMMRKLRDVSIQISSRDRCLTDVNFLQAFHEALDLAGLRMFSNDGNLLIQKRL